MPDDTLADDLVVAVKVTIDDQGHSRTHFYRSLASAQRACERAHARGLGVRVRLVQLVPLTSEARITGHGR